MKTENNISIWKIFVYFIIYSFLGYIIETVFGIFTKGVLESRQSFLYGPFCGIYGLGAVFILVISKFFNKNTVSLFFIGALLGSLIEYFISFLTETLIQIKWWDYSENIFNINGRICLTYFFFWGALTIFLVKILNPKIDKSISFLKKFIPTKILKAFILILIILLLIDCIITCFIQDIFITKIVVEKGIEIENIEKRYEKYNKIQENRKLNTFISKHFNDEKILKTFPNMKIQDINMNNIYIDSLLPDIQTYYYEIFNK